MFFKYVNYVKGYWNRLLWFTCILLSIITLTNCQNSKKKKDGSDAINHAKPNVLLLLADDMRPQLHSYGKTFMHTPNIDQLAKTGMQFNRAYVQVATCEPSRNSLLTGLRPDSIGIYGLSTLLRKAKPNIVTMPQFFRNHGYETISIGGKVFHHGGKDDSLHSGKDDPLAWSRTISVNGKWKGRDYVSSQAIARMKAYQKKHPHKKWWVGKGPAFESPEVADTVYPDGKIAKRGIEQLKKFKQKDSPFFLALGFIATHMPYNAPQKYWDIYPAHTIHLPDSYDPPKDTNRYSLTNYGELRGYSNIPKGRQPVPDSTAKRLIRGYRATISYDDAQIGRVMAALKRFGLDRNTIVVLWGDHGIKNGEHYSWSKHTNYEIDTHIPLIVSSPGMKNEGRSSNGFVETVDIFPTLVELCGLEPPAVLQGKSFVPLMKDPDRSWKPAALSQYSRGGHIMGYSMRTKRYRYTEWVNRSTDEVKARELYDHRRDPEENVNVADKASYKPTIDSLSDLLHKRWKKSLTPGGI